MRIAGFLRSFAMLLCYSTSLASYGAVQANAALRDELLQMGARDQEVRHTTTKVFKSEAEAKAWMQIDADNRRRLKEIISQYGWPTAPMVGSDGVNAAWLIVQHSDDDPEFQRQILATIEPLAEKGLIDRKLYAYLYDRTHYPQRYGTQGDCISPSVWQPLEIEDIERVDERRSEVNLPPLSDYAKLFNCSAPNTLLHDPSDPKRTVAIPGSKAALAH